MGATTSQTEPTGGAVAPGADSLQPPLGSRVTLIPVSSGPERVGTLAEWEAGPAGLVVTLRVALAPDDVAALGGHRVWACVAPGSGGLRVLEGIAAADAIGAELVMTGVSSLAEERRRGAPRVELGRPARLGDGGELRGAGDARTVDLSRTGARLRLPGAGDEPAVAPSARMAVEIAVADDETVTAQAEVVRVDTARGEVAVSFVDLAPDDAHRIDRAVLGELSARHPTGP